VVIDNSRSERCSDARIIHGVDGVPATVQPSILVTPENDNANIGRSQRCTSLKPDPCSIDNLAERCRSTNLNEPRHVPASRPLSLAIKLF
jgi:hypothetical protein